MVCTEPKGGELLVNTESLSSEAASLEAASLCAFPC